MKPHNFATLLVAAVVSLVVAISAYVATQPWTVLNGKGEAMLPALKTSGDKVAAIEIEQGGKVLKLTNKDGKWIIPSQENYPANVDAIYGLAEAAQALGKTAEARRNYFIYLQVIPDGGKAKKARKALDSLSPKQ